MIKGYFIVSIRYFLKNKLFTLINLIGLAVSMAAFIIIIHYVDFERSYDQFHKNKETLYRVTVNQLDEEGTVVGKYATTNAGFGPMMKRHFTEVKEYARLIHTRPIMAKPVLSFQEKRFYEDNIYYADQSFIQMFSYPLVSGDRQSALKEPRSIVLSQSAAEKYFGKADPLDKTLKLQMGARGDIDLKVTGVMRDFPANTHFRADMLISFNTLPAAWNLDEHLDWGDFYVYLQIYEGKDVASLVSGLPEFLKSTLGGYAKYYEMGLQNVQDIHLYSDLLFEAKPTGDGQMVKLLLIVAIMVLAIAWINYINLTTAKSLEYVKEAGLRKMFGATRVQLCMQHLINALALNATALFAAVSISQLAQPFVSRITSVPLDVNLFSDGFLFFSIFSFVLFGSILSGLYPALILSGRNLNQLVKGKFWNGAKGKFTKKSLVIFQFATSATLTALTLVVFMQMDHMQNKDLGMNIDQTLVIKGPANKDSTYVSQWGAFVNKVAAYSHVKAIATSTSIPGQELGWGRDLYATSKSRDQDAAVNIIATGPVFFDLYDMEFLAGRNFPYASNGPANAAILNEEAIKALGFGSPEQAIGRKVAWEENNERFEFKVIGVIRNFNQQSPKQPLAPIIFPLKKYINPPWAGDYYSVKLNGAEYNRVIKHIEKVWQEVFTDNPFDYFFLDSFFDRQYKADRQFGQVFSIFTVLAIFVANLGLLGLFSYTVILRTKEMGIRKVLGATDLGIAKLLSQEYIRLIIIATVIAAPIAYYAALEWLQQFSYRINLGWWFFVLPILMTFVMLVVTLTLQLIKTATTSPVEALRYE